MYNYSNLCDYEFEILCKDIMQKKLGKPLQIFARGRDGGIDITDDTVKKNIVIQVKHYIKSKYADLLSSLKKEVAKVVELAPDNIMCVVRWDLPRQIRRRFMGCSRSIWKTLATFCR